MLLLTMRRLLVSDVKQSNVWAFASTGIEELVHATAWSVI